MKWIVLAFVAFAWGCKSEPGAAEIENSAHDRTAAAIDGRRRALNEDMMRQYPNQGFRADMTDVERMKRVSEIATATIDRASKTTGNLDSGH